MSEEALQKNPVGAPTLYKPEFCQMLIDHMAKGLSYETFGAVIDCGKSTLYRWETDHPEFWDAKEKGLAKSQQFMELHGLAGMKNEIPFFNDRIWSLMMKNRYGWRDKQDIEHSGQIQGQRTINVHIVPALDKNGKEC